MENMLIEFFLLTTGVNDTSGAPWVTISEFLKKTLRGALVIHKRTQTREPYPYFYSSLWGRNGQIWRWYSPFKETPLNALVPEHLNIISASVSPTLEACAEHSP